LQTWTNNVYTKFGVEQSGAGWDGRAMPSSDPLIAALAAVLRERRLARGLTQEQIGDLHRNYVGRVERAEVVPTVTQLARWAAALDTVGSALLAEAERRSGQA
jgi:hypothetical protein